MTTTTLTLSVDIAHLLEEFRCIVRQELATLQQSPLVASTEATGGIELARRNYASE